MKLLCLVTGTIWLILLQSQTAHSEDDLGKTDLVKNTTHNLTKEDNRDVPNMGVIEAVHDTTVNSNAQVSKLSVDVSGTEEYEDDPSDDLEIQASEHELEAVYSGAEGPRVDPATGEEEKPKRRRRRRRRKRRKRIRTSTSGYEDEEKNLDLGELPPAPLELEPPLEASSYPKRRPIKRKRKPSTPIPIEEEYLLTVKNPRRTTVVPSAVPSHIPSSRIPPAAPSLIPSLLPSIAPSHIPENIEDIIEQEPTQDSSKIRQILNSLPPVVVIPTDSGAPLIVPLPTASTPTRNASKTESSQVQGNQTQGPLDPELLTPHGKQNKINVRLSEPLLFVTAPQGIDYTELSRVTQPVKLVPNKVATTASPVLVNVTDATTCKPNVTSPQQPSSHNAGVQKGSLLKKLAVGTGNSSGNNLRQENSSKEITRESSSTTSTTERISNEVRKPIRRPPPVGTLFRKRLPTPHTTTEAVRTAEDTTVSKENELAELKLYTESPLELQKVGPVKLNEIPPTSKTNTHKPVKDVHEKESDNSVYKKAELKLKYTTTAAPVKYPSTPATVKHSSEQRHPEIQSTVKHIPSSPQPVKHITTGTNTAYTPNIDLIIDYTSSTRKPITSTTTSTEQSIQISTADESLNTIIHNEDVRSSGEDEATRIDLEIPQFKDDILIFLKSKAESNKLSRILQSRNMTLEELIEHRERGSSQLHLAEIFKSSPKAIPEADFDLSPPQPPVTEETPMLGSFPNSISQEVLHKDSENRQPKFLFDSLPQFPPMQAEASQTVYSYTTKRLPELQYRRPRPLLPNAKLTPFYGSSEELLLSYTSSTGRPNRFPSNEIVTFRELHEPVPGNKRIPSELKSVITISGAIIAFAVLGFFVLLISCKVRHRKSQKFIKAGMLREHLREATLRSSTRSDNTPVVKNGYYAGCDHTSDTSSTARQTYLWKTIRKTFRYE